MLRPTSYSSNNPGCLRLNNLDNGDVSSKVGKDHATIVTNTTVKASGVVTDTNNLGISLLMSETLRKHVT